MFQNEINTRATLHPALSVFFMILLAGLGFIVGGIAGVFLYLPFFNGTETEMMEVLQDVENNPEAKSVLFAAQAGATLGGLVLAPIIFLRAQRRSIVEIFRRNRLPFYIFLLAGIIVVVSFGLNSFIMEWNQELVFPEYLKSFEDWARARENEAARQTEALTKMDSPLELLIGLLVIAILPAVGEEFVFRGIIQNELYRGTRNAHVAIWFAAILFSAIHFQFFGFIPRMLLGALFGYLYYWSQNLWVPIFAHFINNGAQVIALYFYQRGSFEFDIDKPDTVPLSVLFVSVALTTALLYYFYRHFRKDFNTERL
jgi:uncharacterized protein